MKMNVFRILADVSHIVSKGILIWAIHTNKSAEGVSLLTQALYILVFLSRYIDFFWVSPSISYWNFVLKPCYIVSSIYVVFLMTRVFARTREKETAWKLTTWSLAGCLLSAPLVTLIFEGWPDTSFTEVLWTFSIELESICVLPQLLLLRQTSVPTVIDSFYLVTLGSYRFFYLLSWIEKSAEERNNPNGAGTDPIKVIFGVIQTLLYFDFAWVYWTRQRVKLRGGGVVDGDDLSKSFLVRRFIGGERVEQEVEEDEDTAALARQENGVVNGDQLPKHTRSWGRRGISVSADDTLHENEARSKDDDMADPSAFEDDDFDADADDNVELSSSSKPQKSPSDRHSGAVSSSAGEWGNDSS